MSITLRNLNFLRGVKIPGVSEFGQKLHQTIGDLQTAIEQIEGQTNANGSGQPQPPPQVSALHVTAQDGVFHYSIEHNADFYRSPIYHIEYSERSNFQPAFPIDIGTAREHRAFLGNLTLYHRASASYGLSAPGPWVYYGGSQPIPVVGGGASGPPLPSLSQGSGTGLAGEGLQGPGQTAFRGVSPPQRVS